MTILQDLPRRRKLALVTRFAVLGGVAMVATPFAAQQTAPRGVGMVDDWSHHHMVFSNPGSVVDALRTGTFEKWSKIVNDPRYQMQRRKRSFTRQVAAPAADLAARTPISESGEPRRGPETQALKKDWTTTLGGVTVAASASGSFSAAAASGSKLTITNGTNTLTLTEGSGSGTCTGSNPWAVHFTAGGSGASSATNVAAVLASGTQCSTDIGVTGSSPTSGDLKITANNGGMAGNSISLTWTGTSNFTPAWSSTDLTGGENATVQPNAFPAKFSFGTTAASCSLDFVVYPTGAPGASNEANIIAYNNLYTTGCSTGAVPSTYWAYNTGGTVTTSPVLSLDGSQVAFIQSSGGTASLVLLKWAVNASESITAPDSLIVEASASAYRGCAAPCYFTFSLSANDTFSAPFYDYSGTDDVLYVGDDSGKLHAITGVFSGSNIVEATGFPKTLNASNKVSSPVYDNSSGFVFVGDTGGVLYSVTTAGVIHGNTGSLGDIIADGPVVNGTVGSVTAFVTTSGEGTSFPGSNVVVNFSTGFTNTSGEGIVAVGTGGTGYYLYAGDFDNVYYESSSPSYAGNIWVVGNTGVAGGATLYQAAIGSTGFLQSGTPTSRVTGLNTTAFAFPSPLTEFCNNGASACTSDGTKTTAGTDYVFFSVNRGNKSGCTTTAGNGCILSYNVSNPAAVTQAGRGLTVANPGTNGCWATGGIVIDNSAVLTGASQIYLVALEGNAAGNGTTQTSSNCSAASSTALEATQASQSNP